MVGYTPVIVNEIFKKLRVSSEYSAARESVYTPDGGLANGKPVLMNA
jgi:hypothetical protein